MVTRSYQSRQDGFHHTRNKATQLTFHEQMERGKYASMLRLNLLTVCFNAFHKAFIVKVVWYLKLVLEVFGTLTLKYLILFNTLTV